MELDSIVLRFSDATPLHDSRCSTNAGRGCESFTVRETAASLPVFTMRPVQRSESRTGSVLYEREQTGEQRAALTRLLFFVAVVVTRVIPEA
jgi:hypothetical protein